MNIPLNKIRPFSYGISNARTAPMTPKGGDQDDPADKDIAEANDVFAAKKPGVDEKGNTVH